MGVGSSSTPTLLTELASPEAKVTGIFTYPIKSCRGISLPRAPLTPFGFPWDRQWVVVNSKGRARTQRVEPKLALVEVELPPEVFLEHWKPTTDSVMASEVRNVDPPYVEGQQRIFFSDGYPFLLASQESLDALNKFLEEQIPMNRFRPNILVEGCEPYAEDLWRDIKISRFSYQCVKLCARCKIPQVNQETAIYGTEPTETLMKVRSGHVLRPNQNNKNKVYFGQKTVWNWKDSSAKGGGNMLKMGDSVYIIKKYPSLAEAAA
ncbi:molybdenum cofactor sulfurase-like isoform X1 [Vicia villosa]|uniref:molybdenum cofactor sulfurase-like isoform X1 n=1 Tax=Vicia villosa TaxID=3911 RepID=UPI00273BB0A8|nr:molybdenum cofactor sulfurase-like isoform X1 [Vicia villosa]